MLPKIQVCLLNLECFHFDPRSNVHLSMFLSKSFFFSETMCSHQNGYFLFYKGHSVFHKGPSSGSQPCLNRCAAAHLAEAHGTPVCRGTPVENHWVTVYKYVYFMLIIPKTMNITNKNSSLYQLYFRNNRQIKFNYYEKRYTPSREMGSKTTPARDMCCHGRVLYAKFIFWDGWVGDIIPYNQL